MCFGQTWARNSHQDSAVQFVTAKSGPEAGTKTRQYDLLRPNVGQKEPSRLGSTICYGQTWARKSHQDSAVRFMAKRGPERAIDTRQYDLLRQNVGQKEPPRVGSTICNSQELARKSHRDSAVRFVTAKCGLEKATETRQNDLLRPTVGQKEPPRLGSTICYCQELARKSHQDSVLRPKVGQKEPPRLGSSFFYGQELARKSLRDSAVRFVTAKRGFVTAERGPETATETRQFDVFRPNVGQKKPPRLGSTICYRQTWARTAIKTRQYDLLRPNVGQKKPPRFGSTICCDQTWARKSLRDMAVRFVTTRRGPERATETRQCDLLRLRVGQKEPPRLGSTICGGQTWARMNHQDSAVRFVTAKREPERAIEIRQYDSLLSSFLCFFVTTKSWPQRATKTLQYDLLGPTVGQKEPPGFGSTICYDQTWARKSYRDSAVRCVSAKRGPETATKTRQYNLLPPKVGQKQAPRLGSTICCDQTWARKSLRDLAVQFVTARRGPEKATKTRQYDLWPNVGQKEPSTLGSTICYGQTWARKSHRESAVRFVTAKSWPEKVTETRQYDLLRLNVG